MPQTIPPDKCGERVLPYERLMYQTAWHRLDRHLQNAEDAFADARLDFLERCRQGKVKDLGPARLGGFLRQQVIWQCDDIKNEYGQHAPLVWDEGDTEDGEASQEERFQASDLISDPVESLMEHVFSEEMTKCLDALSEHHRAAFLTVYAPKDTLSYVEAAKLLEIPLWQLNNRLFAARTGLRDCLIEERYPL